MNENIPWKKQLPHTCILEEYKNIYIVTTTTDDAVVGGVALEGAATAPRCG